MSSWTLKIRKKLDNPFKEKGIIFCIFLPVLFFISYFISRIAFNRRRKSYILAPSYFDRSRIKIICIGNIIIGGTGKSPIVRTLAQQFLEAGFFVAIASRGITSKKNNAIFVLPGGDNYQLLSDENLEHYLLLKNFSNKLALFQNPNRYQSLKLFYDLLLKNNGNGVFILDDGLQHFKCPRDINICVWQEDVLTKSPLYSMPIGPYREGFNQSSFKVLLNTFPYRIWSRTTNNHFMNYINSVQSVLKKFNLKLDDEKDLFACYELRFFKDTSKNIKDSNSINLEYMDHFKEQIFNKIKKITVINGISNPEKLYLDLNNYLFGKEIYIVSLGDHAEINESALNILQQDGPFLFTLKDYARWKRNPIFVKRLSTKDYYICTVQVILVNRFQKKITESSWDYV